MIGQKYYTGLNNGLLLVVVLQTENSVRTKNGFIEAKICSLSYYKDSVKHKFLSPEYLPTVKNI